MGLKRACGSSGGSCSFPNENDRRLLLERRNNSADDGDDNGDDGDDDLVQRCRGCVKEAFVVTERRARRFEKADHLLMVAGRRVKENSMFGRVTIKEVSLMDIY